MAAATPATPASPENNEDNIETPRMDVSGLKLDVAQQKEKVSFFEELKKQSFIMSDNSTNKMEGKVNVTDQQRQDKQSFEKQQKELYGSKEDLGHNKGASSSNGRRLQASPDKMVKVPQGNNFVMGKFFGGDDEEPQDMVVKEESEEHSLV